LGRFFALAQLLEPAFSLLPAMPASADVTFDKITDISVGETFDETHSASADDKVGLEAADPSASIVPAESSAAGTAWHQIVIGITQKYSLALISGVLLALVWSNVDLHSYEDFIGKPIAEGAAFSGHTVNLHFLVNDIFMCFFFGLAIKEVTMALLPGGSLNPISRAVNPLMATCGGAVGPVVVYAALIATLFAMGAFDEQMCAQSGPAAAAHRRLTSHPIDCLHDDCLHDVLVHPELAEPCSLMQLLKGWGVPTATDISLAWMFAIQVFGAGHPAINFLLLLAIVDDAIGMVIIAAFYPDPANPVQPIWLLLVVAASALALLMRKLNVRSWLTYVFICGPTAWYGLIRAHVHPAVALVFVVPLMPATHAIHSKASKRKIHACDMGPAISKETPEATPEIPRTTNATSIPNSLPRLSVSSMSSGSVSIGSGAKVLRKIGSAMLQVREEEAPLHVFEEQMKLPVDLGLFFFGLANAGVSMGSVGGMTAAVFLALLVGKTCGIVGFSLLAVKMGFGLPEGIMLGDLIAISAIAGVGLTVALFVANEAFVDPELRGQAKMGALLSVLCGGFGMAFRKISARKR